MDQKHDQTRWRRNRTAVFVLAAVVLLTADGCSRVPQFDPANRRLLEQLRTAVGARRTDWLDATARVANERHGKSQLSDAEYSAVIAIIEQAHAGQWADANAAALRLEKGQGSVAPVSRTTKSAPHSAGPS